MENTFHAEILTPDGKVFEGEVIGAQVPGSDGSFEMKFNHAPITSMLEIGQVRLQTSDGTPLYFAVSGGFVEMSDNRMSVLSEACEKAEEIDVERAERAKERAVEELMKRKEKPKELQLALKRAENRLEVYKRNGA